jgi:alpha/beta superfamily hydrolase
MAGSPESVVVIPGAAPLHAVVHGCACATHPAWGLLFCDPFAEEKKCAHRVMVETARAFCAADLPCVRFDYRGTGDSQGDFADATPEYWVEDIARRELGVRTLGLVGLRLGAALALQAAEATNEVDFLVLWEPVINGRQYLTQNLRRSQIKAMLTDEEQFDAGTVRKAHEDDIFDFDGYPISAEMRRQIEGIDLLATQPGFSGPALVVNITAKEQPGESYLELGEALGGRVLAVRQEPFWSRIGLIEVRATVEATEIWLAEQQAAWMKDE